MAFAGGRRRLHVRRNIKVQGNSGGRVNASHGPGIGAALANGAFTDEGTRFFQAAHGANGALDLEIMGSEALQSSSKPHGELVLVTFMSIIREATEHAAEGFLKHALLKGVSHHGQAACALNADAHFQQAKLASHQPKHINKVHERGSKECSEEEVPHHCQAKGTHLIQGAAKDVNHMRGSHTACCQIRKELRGVLVELSAAFLQVHVRAHVVRQVLLHDSAGPNLVKGVGW